LPFSEVLLPKLGQPKQWESEPFGFFEKGQIKNDFQFSDIGPIERKLLKKVRNEYLHDVCESFHRSDYENVDDQQILETILAIADPRQDSTELSLLLIDECGSALKALSAPSGDLLKICNNNLMQVTILKAVYAMVISSHRCVIKKTPIFSNWGTLINYLSVMVENDREECFRVLYLDKKLQLLANELHGSAEVSKVFIYPREIFKKAMELYCGGVVLVHNHTSGDPTPSKDDLDLTKNLERVGKILDVEIIEHIIIGDGKWIAMRKDGFL
jgi:DNA repair protein RadC